MKALRVAIAMGVFWSIAVFLLLKGDFGKSAPMVEKGILDLNNWDFGVKNSVPLDGEWAFYWQNFINPADFDVRGVTSTEYCVVPGSWTSQTDGGKRHPGFGYATYHLEIRIPNADQRLALRLDTVSTAYRCYIDGVLVSENGVAGKDAKSTKPYYMPGIVEFQPKDETVSVVMHVSNFSYNRGGIWYQIELGSPEQIKRRVSFQIYKDAMILGALIIMSIYFTLHWLWQRQEKSYLHFVMMSLILAVRTTLYGDYLMVRLFPDISFGFLVYLTYASVYWSAVESYLLVRSIFVKKAHYFPARIITAIGIMLSVVLVFVPMHVYTGWILHIEVGFFAVGLIALMHILQACRRGEKDALAILAGVLMLMGTWMHDALFQMNRVNHAFGELSAVGMIFFLIMAGLIISRQRARLLEEKAALSERLKAALTQERYLNEKLTTADRVKDRFLMDTSHELRTPLNAIKQIAQALLKGTGGKPNGVQKQNLSAIVYSSERLLSMIESLMDISAIKDGKIKLESKRVSLKKMVNNTLFILDFLKEGREIELVNRMEEEVPDVWADDHRLRQVLVNIIDNAIQYTRQGRITIDAKGAGESVEVIIEDSGIGIGEAELENLLKAMHADKDEAGIRQPGAGLGLYISAELMRLMGGEIRIFSTEGTGTKVILSLSAASAAVSESGELQADQQVIEIDREEGGQSVGSDERILLWEEDWVNRRALINLLELEGHRVKSTATGMDIMDLLEQSNRFNLVILDATVSEMLAFEMLQRIRLRYGLFDMPVLILTGRNQVKDMGIAFMMGANDYITMPFSPDELIARVRNLTKIKETVSRLVAAELSFLQAQIKPHFIFNALSVISSLSTREPKKAKGLILDLSDYLRACFDFENEDGLTLLSRELVLLRAYLSIESVRFEGRIEISIEVDEDIDCTLPVLVLQPLVENAIRHGIMNSMQGGRVAVKINREDQYIRIRIEDDGVGMNQADIQAFLENRQERRGVGISNIHRRLLSMYGKGLNIESEPGRGTRIFFEIPYE